MAYDKAKLFEQSKSIMQDEHIYFVEDIVSLLPCSKATFYEYFPAGSDELNALKDLLEQNKMRMKAKLRAKLSRGEKAAEILALYKLIATDDERKALSMTHVDHTTKGETINIISLGNGSPEPPSKAK